MKPHEECDLPIGHQGECRELLDLTPVGPGKTIADVVKREPFKYASDDYAGLVAELRDPIGIRRDGSLMLGERHVRAMRDAADAIERLSAAMRSPKHA
ncbi:MAG TPA: hypothetical protein VNS88_13075 [Nitrospiraceae bacterium]|nr:hypothetical protein [Nitrospiraceae bacterium]